MENTIKCNPAKETRPGTIIVCVSDKGGTQAPISNAHILVYAAPKSLCDCRNFNADKWCDDREGPDHNFKHNLIKDGLTDDKGYASFTNLPSGIYIVVYNNYPKTEPQCVKVECGCTANVCLKPDMNVSQTKKYFRDICETTECHQPMESGVLRTKIEYNGSDQLKQYVHLKKPDGSIGDPTDPLVWEIQSLPAGKQSHLWSLYLNRILPHGGGEPPAIIAGSTDLNAAERPNQPIAGNIGVTLRRTAANPTKDQALWVAIRNRTRALSFSGSGYKDFIDRVLCGRHRESPESPVLTRQLEELGSNVYGVGAYELLKTATQTFLLLECGVAINNTGTNSSDVIFEPQEEANRLGKAVSLNEIQGRLTEYLGGGRLPYINRIVKSVFPGDEVGNVHCYGVLTSKVDGPCLIELIWNYWIEEGMLVQTMNAISRRFQNVRGPGGRDPLAHLEIDPLRPLNNLLWGYIQDEQHRLTVKRRTYEYDHHYGLTLYGKAVPTLRSADSRSKFLEGFHNLLHLCSVFFKEDNDTTIIADGFPLLNALKEVHLLLAQGAHNQFGDLPWKAREEMLIQEWLLARPEMREFLQSRPMVPYKEAWMGQVDTMKTLQGWTDVTVTHFRDLGVFGEQILLSIRYGDWIDINFEDSAKNWARYWRPEIQGYLHAYRATTGVDLTNPDAVDYAKPAVHLQKRLLTQTSGR
ncbi:MAG: hypothetical protein HS132_13030 [Planctomycetia bacterium]|nr:hypothetical protein [Planctomycetia bacterium]